MKPTFAKKMAEARGYHFYWDYQLRMYACYPTDLNPNAEASYHTKQTLECIGPERFETLFLPIEFHFKRG